MRTYQSLLKLAIQAIGVTFLSNLSTRVEMAEQGVKGTIKCQAELNLCLSTLNLVNAH